jgi:hypothetical protein
LPFFKFSCGKIRSLIAVLTRGTKLAAPQAHASESHRVKCLVSAQSAGKALDEVSAAIPGDAVAGNAANQPRGFLRRLH